ncbi:MAG: copper chaperone PCu(A)C [Alphaproteobacteria bacterium]|jgi:hypothetical protein|nr:copper chaperone PCu(A)C [Alphaproteobacteria bacterium]
MRTLLTTGALALAISTAVPASAAEYKVGEITVTDPWARASAGPARNGGAYLTIKSGGAGDRLTRVDSGVAKRTELHNHINDGGVMKMRPVDGIDVPAGGMAMLKPGGYHVMLMKLKQPLKQGESFPMTLHFTKAGKVEVEVEIKAVGAMGPGKGQGHGGHGKMKMKN